jgi:hypothetical protein
MPTHLIEVDPNWTEVYCSEIFLIVNRGDMVDSWVGNLRPRLKTEAAAQNCSIYRPEIFATELVIAVARREKRQATPDDFRRWGRRTRKSEFRSSRI